MRLGRCSKRSPGRPPTLDWPSGCRRGAERCGSAACRARAARCWRRGWPHGFPQRLLAIVAPTPGDAERWLTDLAHLTDEGVALYPQREALGEDEPHYEIAGERAETIEALLQGRLRLLVTTARATAERTLMPAALERLRLRLATGDRRPPAEVARHPRADGVPAGPDGDRGRRVQHPRRHPRLYGFGMAAPRGSNGGATTSRRSGASTSPPSARCRS